MLAGRIEFMNTSTTCKHGERGCGQYYDCGNCAREKRAKKGAMTDSNWSGTERFDGSPLPITRNHHPTVKPTALMRYLCRLVTPPGGVVLDPFMGSGSTGKATAVEGFRFIGIEQDETYFNIAHARIQDAYSQRLI